MRDKTNHPFQVYPLRKNPRPARGFLLWNAYGTPTYDTGLMSETLVSSYILRLSIKRNRWQIGLHNVRTGEALVFSSFEDLARHLETHSFQIVNASSFHWNADGTPLWEDEPMK